MRNVTIKEKIKNTKVVRLRGLEERKECLQEVRNTKAKRRENENMDELALCDGKKPLDLSLKWRKKMNSGYVLENVLIRCGGSLVGNESFRLEGLKMKINDEDDED
uniref:Uncharacterized protein n=1 Tax=Tanacetum cinerariifolium TaxID=118510 RepID=A0A6L2L476_TANCI|nr:hypothetical protein [Tanacetum cinerariifolium]